MNQQPEEGKTPQQASVDVLSGNRIIAEFMGSEFNEEKKLFYKGGMFCNTFPNGNHYARQNQLKYHSSWDWLMPVVEKINEFMVGEKVFRVMIMPTQTMISVYAHGGMSVPMKELNFFVGGKSKIIDATLECIIQFVQWYNTQTKKQ